MALEVTARGGMKALVGGGPLEAASLTCSAAPVNGELQDLRFAARGAAADGLEAAWC